MFEMIYGVSDNERAWCDNQPCAYDLGYQPDRPRRRTTRRARDCRAGRSSKPDPVGDFYQGGTFCGMEFDGDKSRIWKLK